MVQEILTAQRLRELLHYDPETGVFTRLRPSSGRKPADGQAGFISAEGYRRIWVAGCAQQAHRLAWLWVHGAWPTHGLDHIDGDPSNNRIDNLRDVSAAINSQNRKSPCKGSKSGFLGVSWCAARKRWRAAIWVDGKFAHLGYYATQQLGHNAYLAAKRRDHAGCTI